MLSQLSNNKNTEYPNILLLCMCYLLMSCLTNGTLAQLVNGDFESPINTVGSLPTAYGYWQGDMSEITGSGLVISPYENDFMLRFIYATMDGPSALIGSELWQIIDVSSWHKTILSGNAQSSASGYFNRVTGDAETDTSFAISLFAYAGIPETFPEQWNYSELAQVSGSVISEDNPISWESVQVTLPLPTVTDFVVIRISATENIFNDITGDEFDGHFADNIQFQVIPGPAAILLLIIAGFFCTTSRRFKHKNTG